MIHTYTSHDLFKNKHLGKSIYFLNTGPDLNNYDFSQIAEKHSYSIKNIPITHCNTEYWACFENVEKTKVSKETWKKENIKLLGNDVYYKYHKLPNTYLVVVKPDYNPKTFLTNPHVSWGLNRKVKDKDGFEGRRSIFLGTFPLLYNLGFRKIYLLGVDFNMDITKPYADSRAKSEIACNENNLLYETLAVRCMRLQKYFKKHELEVFNCNKESKLTVFPYISFQDSLNDPNLCRN